MSQLCDMLYPPSPQCDVAGRVNDECDLTTASGRRRPCLARCMELRGLWDKAKRGRGNARGGGGTEGEGWGMPLLSLSLQAGVSSYGRTLHPSCLPSVVVWSHSTPLPTSAAKWQHRNIPHSTPRCLSRIPPPPPPPPFFSLSLPPPPHPSPGLPFPVHHHYHTQAAPPTARGIVDGNGGGEEGRRMHLR